MRWIVIKNLVSVVMPTYNDALYLKNAVEDILNQTYKQIELIIVDDGSTDNTQEVLDDIVKQNPSCNIKIYTKKNGGTGSALNSGFSLANGEFGTWVSSDDRKSNTMIEELCNVLKSNRDVEYVCSSYRSSYFNKDIRSFVKDDSRKGYSVNMIASKTDLPLGGLVVVDEWLDLNLIECHQGVNFMFTMRLKRDCGEYITIPGEDYEMSARMGLQTRVAYLDKVLGEHKNPADSISMVNRNCVVEANLLTHQLIRENKRNWKYNYIPKIANFFWENGLNEDVQERAIVSFKRTHKEWSVYVYRNEKALTSKKLQHMRKNNFPMKILNIMTGENAFSVEAVKEDALNQFGGLWLENNINYKKHILDCEHFCSDEGRIIVKYEGKSLLMSEVGIGR